MKMSIFILFLSAALLTGCSTGQGEVIEDNVSVYEYFPLAQGNHWTYAGDGMEYASFTIEVIYTEGNKYQTTENNGGTISSTVYAVTDESVTVIYSMGEEYDMENALGRTSNRNDIILKAPLEMGNRWESSGLSYEIVSVDETVITPAGIMEDCLKVRIDYPDSTVFSYYCRGIGMVLNEFMTGDTRITSTLESYDVE